MNSQGIAVISFLVVSLSAAAGAEGFQRNQTKEVVQTDAQTPLLGQSEFGGARSCHIFLGTDHAGRVSLNYGATARISEVAAKVMLLENENVQKEIELVSEQRQKIKSLIAEYKSVYAKFSEKSNVVRSDPHKSGLEELRQWVIDEANSFDQKAMQILHEHQIEYLERIQINYLVTVFGYARILENQVNNKQLDFSKRTIDLLRKKELELSGELKRKCVQFVDEEFVSILDVLDEKQKALLLSTLADSRIREFPELLVAQALYLNDDKSSYIAPDNMYCAWSSQVFWTLEYDGTFSQRTQVNGLFDFEYFITAVRTDSDFKKILQLTEDQDLQLELLNERLKLVDLKFSAQQKEANGSDSKLENLKRAWAKEKLSVGEEQIKRILSFEQLQLVAKRSDRLWMNRYGVVWGLHQGELGKQMDLTTVQRREIKKSIDGINRRYEKFSEETADWFFEELSKIVEDKAENRKFKEFFNRDFRIVNCPIGCMANYLTVRNQQ